MDQAASLIAEADRAASARDFTRASDLLEQATAQAPSDLGLWMRLAAMRRASGQAAKALEAVHNALAISPRDFTALLMRASLLERLGDPGAGLAWGQALAQKPSAPIPAQLQSIVEEGEQRYAAWTEQRDAALKAAMAAAERSADEDQRKKMARFRSNVVRRTRHYHSEPTDYHYPGLTEREFHPRSRFPWLERLESATAAIRSELRNVMAAERAELVPYVQMQDHAPMDQWRPLNQNLDWTAIHLIQHGRVVEANAQHCPTTIELLSQMPQPDVPGASPNAMFSLLAPRTTIPPHVGISNTRLVCHLPLVVPEGCWFRVGAEKREWREGEAFVFDDTIEHEAANPTDDLRVVLIFDVWHPDLQDCEREAVAALISSSADAAQGL